MFKGSVVIHKLNDLRARKRDLVVSLSLEIDAQVFLPPFETSEYMQPRNLTIPVTSTVDGNDFVIACDVGINAWTVASITLGIFKASLDLHEVRGFF